MKRVAMNRLRHNVAMAGGFVLLSAVSGLFTARPAIAQAVRAVLMKNVDEPGRSPYQSSHHVSSGSGSPFCVVFAGHCYVQFDRVPAGKRLVVERAAAVLIVRAPSFPMRLDVTSDANGAPAMPFGFQLLPGLVNTDQFQYGVDASPKYYVEPGLVPTLDLTVYGSVTDIVDGQLGVSGYLVDPAL